jgi:hypothetical protein
MRLSHANSVFISILILLFFTFFDTSAHANEKEWTFLIYLNGNNNLDSYGKVNLNQMEQVGSTDQINVVVQWASLENRKTQRLYVIRDQDSKNVTSPILDTPGNVDMGDWHNLVEFVRWGVEKFPAKHYFIDIWDHGTGWHDLKNLNLRPASTIFHPTDISWDDITGNSITTIQLGDAMRESAKIIGHKVDLYASDACLMSMAEVAQEVSDSVEIFAGSQEVEPGAGWPYQTFLKRWTEMTQPTSRDVAKALTEEYVKSYTGGVNGTQNVTFSAFDLAYLNQLNGSVFQLGKKLNSLDSNAKAKVIQAIQKTQNFTYSDYGDLNDFTNQLEAGNIPGITPLTLESVKYAIQLFVFANGTSEKFKRASGVSIWLPMSVYAYSSYSDAYRTLKFHAMTQWGDALNALFR